MDFVFGPDSDEILQNISARNIAFVFLQHTGIQNILSMVHPLHIGT